MKIRLTFEDLGKLLGNRTGFEKNGATIKIDPRVHWEVTLDNPQPKNITAVFRDEAGQ